MTTVSTMDSSIDAAIIARQPIPPPNGLTSQFPIRTVTAPTRASRAGAAL
ncbi:hypothetical protein GCM10022224_078950 [Nonomuraea antimicrobica]|uniref:Uncharacterized protein n=1 Tax=Nonomuraea antimicrobica TaxID=561173 RepID=A0ABP7D925_9ACTN